ARCSRPVQFRALKVSILGLRMIVFVHVGIETGRRPQKELVRFLDGSSLGFWRWLYQLAEIDFLGWETVRSHRRSTDDEVAILEGNQAIHLTFGAHPPYRVAVIVILDTEFGA